MDAIGSELKEEFREEDPGLTVALEGADKVDSAVTPEDSGALITMGYLLPNGMLAQSPRLGIPITSLNVGVILQSAEYIDFDCCLRSPFRSSLD